MDWIKVEDTRGCLFLRATFEVANQSAVVGEMLRRHKTKMRDLIVELVAAEAGPSDELAEQILVLFEGATAAAVYRGSKAIEAARNTAATLIAAARHEI